MKKITYDGYGSLSKLQMRDIEAPRPADDEILIQVKAVSINPLDWKIVQGDMKMLTGKKFPKGIGIDFAGVVSSVGSNTRGFSQGDAVMGALDAMKGTGALAQWVCVKPQQIVAKPASLDFEQAAALPIVGAAALQSLTRVLQLKAGQRLLINGATGGVGMLATQIAVRLGVLVTAVVSSKGVEWAQKWGAQSVVNYQTQSVPGLTDRFDAVLDLSGKLPYDQAEQLLAPQGQYVNATPTLSDILRTPLANLFRSKKVRLLISSPDASTLQALSQWADQGVEVHVSQRYNWTAFASAYPEVKERSVLGKAVFVVDAVA